MLDKVAQIGIFSMQKLKRRKREESLTLRARGVYILNTWKHSSQGGNYGERYDKE